MKAKGIFGKQGGLRHEFISQQLQKIGSGE